MQLAGQPGGAAEDLDPITAALARACPDLDLPGLDPLVDGALAEVYARAGNRPTWCTSCPGGPVAGPAG